MRRSLSAATMAMSATSGHSRRSASAACPRTASTIKSSPASRGPGMSPCGRNSRITTTTTNTKASRKARRSGGSSACRRIEPAPTKNPPNAAPGRLPRPPITVPTKAMITNCKPMRGCTTPVCTTIRHDTAAARRPLSAKAIAITLLARTPKTRAMRKSSAAARICKPSRVALRNQVNATKRTMPTTMVTIWSSCSRMPKKLDLPAELRQEIESFEARADEEDQELLQEKAHSEGRDQQRRRVGIAQRPESRSLRQQRQQHRNRDGAENHHRHRHVRRAQAKCRRPA